MTDFEFLDGSRYMASAIVGRSRVEELPPLVAIRH